MSDILSLYELNQLVRIVIEGALPDTFLVTAEIASCDIKTHCYLTLVDKEEDIVRAEVKAVIWSNRYRVIAPIFEEATGIKLAKGIKVLFQVSVSFHERYGLKLNIVNIDPSYTIGEMAVKRKEILERLAKEELINKNKGLDFPLVPQRIGIISSATAAGYEDLMTHLTGNVYGYKFAAHLYEAVMQGDRAEASVADALRRCRDDISLLDVVVIVRGGGGQLDLHCFDSYEIGRAIALLPVPVISGIGHQRDVSVADEVSHTRAKTPTAVADILINRIREFEDRIDLLSHNMLRGSQKLASDMKEALFSLSRKLEIMTRNQLLNNSHKLKALARGLQYSIKFLQNEKQRTKTREISINHLNPMNVLKRGYSITLSNGKILKSFSDIEKGNKLVTILYDGEVASNVESKKKSRRKL